MNLLFYLNIFIWTKSSFNNTRTVSQQRTTLLITTTMMTWRTEKTKPGESKCWSSQKKSQSRVSLSQSWPIMSWSHMIVSKKALIMIISKKSWSWSSQKSLDHDCLKESLDHNWSCLDSLSPPTVNFFSMIVKTIVKTLLSILVSIKSISRQIQTSQAKKATSRTSEKQFSRKTERYLGLWCGAC